MKTIVIAGLCLLSFNSFAQLDAQTEERLSEMESRIQRLEEFHDNSGDPSTPGEPTNYVLAYTSASVQTLYWNCGNTLNLRVPGLTNDDTLEYLASSATVLPSTTDPRKLTVVPSGKRTTLQVKQDSLPQGSTVTALTFNVIKPPKPTIELLVNNKLYNGAALINKRSTIVVRVKPDADFRALLPQDARYQISRVDLMVQRSLGAPVRIATFSGNGKDGVRGIPIALGNRLRNDTPGTKIYFKIDKVFRVNFQNKKVEEKYSDRELYLGAMIK